MEREHLQKSDVNRDHEPIHWWGETPSSPDILIGKNVRVRRSLTPPRFMESDARVWAFDGGRNLSLTTHKSNTPTSDTLISYGPNRFPCEVSYEVASRLPEAFRQTIVANE